VDGLQITIRVDQIAVLRREWHLDLPKRLILSEARHDQELQKRCEVVRIIYISIIKFRTGWG
jgi:hypothetical protein